MVIPAFLLHVPLVGAVFIVYFFTSFIPYLGAWIGGAFVVFLAYSSGGVNTAIIMAVLVIVSNGFIQTLVNSWAVGSTLKMNPVIVFVVTILAGMIGGILAMILAVPLVDVTFKTISILREAKVFDDID